MNAMLPASARARPGEQSREFTVPADDGRDLAATLFAPDAVCAIIAPHLARRLRGALRCRI